MDELFALHDSEKVNVLENAIGGADERFAHMRTRVNGLIENKVVNAGAGEVRTERGTGGPAADDDDGRVEIALSPGFSRFRCCLRRTG
jgi:hypothetical protein